MITFRFYTSNEQVQSNSNTRNTDIVLHTEQCLYCDDKVSAQLHRWPIGVKCLKCNKLNVRQLR